MAMNIQINSTNYRYADGALEEVQVFFQANNDDRTLTASGYVPLTQEEYESNFTLTALKSVVRTKLAEAVADDGSAPEPAPEASEATE